MNRIYFPFIVFFVYIFLVFNKIHSSSIGFYHQFFYGNKKDYNLIFGYPRAIRSDEWLVGTPKFIAQAKAGFPTVNKNLGFGEVMPVQGCSPYKHWRVIFCPNMWPFFFLPLENAFSASWWFGSLLMILAIYYFILLLTNSVFTAIVSPLIFFFTPFNQWWTYSLSSFLGYGLLFIVFFIKAVSENRNKLKSLIYIILSGYFLAAYAFILYPPFQVAVFYVLGLMLLGILWQKKLIKKTFFFGILSIILTLIPIIGFYVEFKEIINVVQNTVYPGKRFISNSLGNFLYLISGFYNIQLLDDIKGSGPFANQSEASNFFMISLFSLPVYFWILIDQIKKKKVDPLFLSLMLSFIILLIWFLFPLPSFVAKFSLLFLVPQKRALIGLGIVNYLLAIYFLNKIKIIKNSFYCYLKWLSVFLIFFTNLYLGFLFKFSYSVFIQKNFKIFLISVVSGFLVYLLLSQKKKLFLVSLLIFSFISTYLVNPLYKGLDPVINTELARFIQEKIKKEGNRYYWVNYSSIHLENYFLANGAKSLSGVFYYPQYQLMKVFDKKNNYQQIWNRYSHTNYFYNPDLKERFVLFSLDNYGINISPCDFVFKQLKAKYFLSESLVNQRCLKLEKKILRFYIYRKLDI